MDTQPRTIGLDAQIQRILERVKPDSIERFKKWLRMPKDIAEHPVFDAQNAVNWVPRLAYAEFIQAGIGRSAYKPVKSTCVDVSDSEHDDSSSANLLTTIPLKKVKRSTIDVSFDSGEGSASTTSLGSKHDDSHDAKPLVKDVPQKKPITYVEISEDEPESETETISKNPGILPATIEVKQPEYIVISDDEGDQPEYIVISDDEVDPRKNFNPPSAISIKRRVVPAPNFNPPSTVSIKRRAPVMTLSDNEDLNEALKFRPSKKLRVQQKLTHKERRVNVLMQLSINGDVLD